MSAHQTSASSSDNHWRIAAVGLTNPRGMAWDDDGNLYVASGGMGGPTPSGPDRHIEAPLGPYHGGHTALIYRITPSGEQSVFVDNLPSTRDQFRGKQGVSDVKWVNGKLYALIVGAGQAHGNPDDETGLLRIEADGSWEQFAFIGPWHRAHPVEAEVPHYFPEGSLFAFTWVASENAFWYSEANSNYVGRITMDGEISRVVDLSANNDVLSGITPSENGVYVGHMSVVPYAEGKTFVSEVLPDGTTRRAWTNLTMVAGLTHAPDGELVASLMSTDNTVALPHFRPNAGKVVRRSGPDRFEVIAQKMTLPIRVETGPDGWLYVATPGIGADNGSGIIVALNPAARALELDNPTLMAAADKVREAGMVSSPDLAPRRYPHEVVPGEEPRLSVRRRAEMSPDAQPQGDCVMRWADLVARQPALAQTGRELLIAPGVLLVGTTRRDGTARISPVEPLLMAGDLWLSMLLGSQKAGDLLRDPRILVQSITTNPDGKAGEFRLRGTAHPTDDPALVGDYAATVAREIGWQPVPGQFHLFRIAFDAVTYIRYENGDQYLTRWPDGGETVRRAITPTSLGPAESTHQLLVDDAADRQPAGR